MLPLLLALLADGAAAPPAAEKPVQISDWQPFFENGAIDDARKTCEGWLSSPLAQTRAEAHKCLAHVALARGRSGPAFEAADGDGSGRVGVIGEALDPQAAEKAADHLDVAVKLAPGDVTIHQARLHVLSSAGLYGRMMTALDESAATYRIGDTVGDVWLDYFGELFARGARERAIDYLRVLAKHFPSDHRVVGNLAALYLQGGEYEVALPWAKEAVALAPRDVIDRVNLARVRHKLGKWVAAMGDYDVAMTLPADEDRKALVRCWYADLLADMGRTRSACRLQREALGLCPAEACPR